MYIRKVRIKYYIYIYIRRTFSHQTYHFAIMIKSVIHSNLTLDLSLCSINFAENSQDISLRERIVLQLAFSFLYLPRHRGIAIVIETSDRGINRHPEVDRTAAAESMLRA